jgi:uncharacterized membrane protein YoaK (UPF0700 family)
MTALPIPDEVRRQAWLAIMLAAVAGFVDAYGIIRYGAYLSFMSGNTTLAGYHTGQRDFAAVLPPVTGILAFVAGAFSGTLFMHRSRPCARRTIFVAIAAALALATGLIAAGFLSATASIAFISFVMGAMNTSLSRVGAQSINLTFVTGALNRLGTHLALAVARAPLTDGEGPWDTHSRRALLLGGIWLGFFLGAAISGATTPFVGPWILLAPACALVALALLDRG